jgi:hypothetical protein
VWLAIGDGWLVPRERGDPRTAAAGPNEHRSAMGFGFGLALGLGAVELVPVGGLSKRT